MKRVVSVSIGSSTRDKNVEARFAGVPFSIERKGTDGDLQRAAELVAELDGRVDAIGLGGIDLYLIAGGRKYTVGDAAKIAANAKTTPVVDGSGLKNTLEREAVRQLAENNMLHAHQPEIGVERLKVLVTSAVDRFGLAEGFADLGADVVFGDLIFAIGVPIAMTRLWQVNLAARTFLPILCRLPFRYLYPTGEKQENAEPRHTGYYQWADIITGDMHFIKRYLPAADHAAGDMTGKTVLTNTTTDDDVQQLKQRGLHRLITTTPRFQGRTFGTNVMEGVVIALSERPPDQLTGDDYLEILGDIGPEPNVMNLNNP